MKANVPKYNKKEIKRKMSASIDCTIHAAVLAMSDLSEMSRSKKAHRKSFTFGQKRADKFVSALTEILYGYADQSEEELLQKMLEEEKGRGLEVTIDWSKL